jgi:hypothetical protein
LGLTRIVGANVIPSPTPKKKKKKKKKKEKKKKEKGTLLIR